MARAQYTETPELKALRELIDYAENPAAKGVHSLPTWWMLAGAGRVTGEAWEAVGTDPSQWEKLRLEVRALLRYLAGTDSRPGLPPAHPTRIQVELWPARTDPWPASGTGRRPARRRPGTKQVTHYIRGTVRNVMLYQVVTLLEIIGGVERLRLCPAPDCGRAFLKIGRRDYCSDRCRQRVFLSTYDPFAAKPRRADRPRVNRATKGH